MKVEVTIGDRTSIQEYDDINKGPVYNRVLENNIKDALTINGEALYAQEISMLKYLRDMDELEKSDLRLATDLLDAEVRVT